MLKGIITRSLLLLTTTATLACSSGSPSKPASPGTGGAAPMGTGGTGGTPPVQAPPPGPVETLPPHAALEKVKGLLTGLPATDEELAAAAKDGKLDRAALAGLVTRWMGTPEYRARMLRFFQQAFQQTQTELGDYADLLDTNINGWDNVRLLLSSLEESFARTVLALIEEGRPFTDVATTDRFMLNPPLMALLAALDSLPLDNDLRVMRRGIWILDKYPMFTLVRTDNPDPVTGAPRPIPFTETIDPKSPNFMRIFDPNKSDKAKPECAEPQTVTGAAAVGGLYKLMWGQRPAACGNTTGVFQPADYEAWRMVTIRPPKGGEERTLFWDVPRFRDPKTAELVLVTPRVGFMTTLAFFANWPTNDSNAHRVTTNQALIVGLGRSFDDTGTTVQLSETSVEALHIQPGTTCFGCHQTLDPMRDFFRQSFNVAYSPQHEPAKVPMTAAFTVDGSPPVTGNGVRLFGRAMAEHPRFALAWTQKLCRFANARSCVESDPEFVRIANVWKASRFQFPVLIRELFSSPLVTFSEPTKSAEASGLVVSITRREALCAALKARLGVADPCGEVARNRNNLGANLAQAIPGAAYARGEEEPLMPHDPNLFFTSGTDNLCVSLAASLVDAARSRWTSARTPEAIAEFVSVVMGLPPADPRAAPMKTLLTDHHAAALKAGAAASIALRSTFVAACTSPFALSHGL